MGIGLGWWRDFNNGGVWGKMVEGRLWCWCVEEGVGGAVVVVVVCGRGCWRGGTSGGGVVWG